MKAIITALIATTMLTACAKNYYEQGYKIKQEQVDKLKVNQHTKLDVQRLLGSPSFSSSFSDDTWVYLSTTRYNKPLDQNILDKREMIVLNFENNRLTSISQKNEKDGAEVKPAKEITKTQGRQLNVVEQLFQNITGM